MEKDPAPTRWWDWASLALLFVLLEIVASRLIVTTWTPNLYLVQNATYIAFVVGTALGFSRFSVRLSRWLSLAFLILMLPLQWTLMIDQNVSLEDQLTSVAGRLFFSTSDFLARRPVDDPLFFVVIMTIVFWFLSAWAAFTLVRNQNYLAAVLPCAIGFMVIQGYDRGHLWILAVFGFVALLLLGRLHYLQNMKSWRERRIFLSPDNGMELTSSMAIAAGLLILLSWTIPASLTSWTLAQQNWDIVTKPWQKFTDRMENAVSALKSPNGGRPGEFYSSQLQLGSGWPLSDAVMFKVQAPGVPADQRPPRYYWQGRSYNFFKNGEWFSTGTERDEYSPTDTNPLLNLASVGKTLSHFIFQTGNSTFSLLYFPNDPIRIDHPGFIFAQPSDSGKDLVAWHANPSLQAGETYAVDVLLKNPNQDQLRTAGTNYPDWVTSTYLQLPDHFSPRITQLAQDITAGTATPYDKTTAITNYLRKNIEYAATVDNPPANQDPLEWFLFDYKKGFCVYYASSEVVMLRSLGIPARMTVGFAQGDQNGNTYTVRRLHAHAWPEVYFPGIGWVEFEPTASQPALDRPLPLNEQSQANAGGPSNIPRAEDHYPDRAFQDENGIDTATVAKPLSPLLFVIPIIILLATGIFFLNRRFAFAKHVPVLVHASLERSGMGVPKWVLRWESWVHLSQIERAFESINFGLHNLDKQAVPVHNTPSERAGRLTNLLPQMSDQIKLVLDEHQTYLYTSRVADVDQARRAALDIRKQVIIERFRYLFSGKPNHD